MNLLIEKLINELTYNGFVRKQQSVGKLFPSFGARVDKVADNGGIRLINTFPEVWHFKVASGTEEGKQYNVYLRFKDIDVQLKRWASNKTLWNKQGTSVDYRKLASEMMNDLDLEADCACLTGDTKIPLLNGKTLTMSELVSEYGTTKKFWVYASDENGDFVPAKARCVGVTGLVKNLIEIELDNGKTIKCTYDHKFRLRDGTYREAKDLKVNDSLMPLYLKVQETSHKYSQTYLKFKLNSKVSVKGMAIWKTVHRQVAETILYKEFENKKKETVETEKQIIIHHNDFNTFNNCPENFTWMGVKEHLLFHAENVNRENITIAIKKYYNDLANKEKIHENTSRAGKIGGNKCKDNKIGWFSKESHHKATINRNKTYWSKLENHIKASLKLLGRKISDEGRENMSLSWTDERRQKQSERMKILNKNLQRNERGANNHKVKAIRYILLDKHAPVYDLCVEKYSNFALEAGIFVHNCPADTFWGPEYIKTQRQAQFGDQENRPPKIRNPKQYGALCKHCDLVFAQLPMYVSTFAKFLKDFYHNDIDKIVKISQDELGVFKKAAKELGKNEQPPSPEQGNKPVKVNPKAPKTGPNKEQPKEEIIEPEIPNTLATKKATQNISPEEKPKDEKRKGKYNTEGE